MARFLEVNTTIGNAQFPAGNYLINIDKITSLNGEEIKHYIKELQKVPVSSCIKQIRKKYS